MHIGGSLEPCRHWQLVAISDAHRHYGPGPAAAQCLLEHYPSRHGGGACRCHWTCPLKGVVFKFTPGASQKGKGRKARAATVTALRTASLSGSMSALLLLLSHRALFFVLMPELHQAHGD
jgi:hypothetical protein